ncbi:unknown [Bacteroides thetaiotaomicron CAG:40]|nr:unknown [Bacteroides thetaiotaomicron CAG:40]
MGMSPEIRKLLICMEMVVAEDDVIQLILLDNSFQPGNILRKIFTFQADFNADLIFIFLL